MQDRPSGLGRHGAEGEKIAEHIIALERAALAEWCKGNPSPYLELYAPELTYFDPLTPRRWDLDDVRELYERIRGQLLVDRFEMVSPRVQIHGDTAVLTFNYTSSGFVGMWNCTEVYRRFRGDDGGSGDRFSDGDGNNGGSGGRCSNDCPGDRFSDGGPGDWRIVHSHWSDVHPKP